MGRRNVHREPPDDIRGQEPLSKFIAWQIPLARDQNNPLPRESQAFEEPKHFIDFTKYRVTRTKGSERARSRHGIRIKNGSAP
jgi:hypothetical protein